MRYLILVFVTAVLLVNFAPRFGESLHSAEQGFRETRNQEMIDRAVREEEIRKSKSIKDE